MSGSAIVSSTCPHGCRVASNSASPSPGRWPTRPEVIVADEPTGNLDSESAGEVMTLLIELQQGDGVTVIVATHDPEVGRHATRLLKLRDGLVVEDVDT